MLPRQSIPRDQWRQELDSFSRSHDGWLVKVRVTERSGDARPRIEAQYVPLSGLSVDRGDPPTIDVMVGEDTDRHLTHQIEHVQRIDVEKTGAGVIAAIVMTAEDGTETAIELRTAMRPEEVDGMPFPHRRVSPTKSRGDEHDNESIVDG